MPRPTILHRAFLQSLLSRRYLLESTASTLFTTLLHALVENGDKIDGYPEREKQRDREREERLSSGFLNELNDALSEVGMEVKRLKEETPAGRRWLAIVNTDPTEISQSATDLTPLEITYFRSLLLTIIDSYPQNSITSLTALRLSSKVKPPIAKSAAEVLLNGLTRRGWLEKSKRGRYSVGPRGLMELSGWLVETYNGERGEEEEEETLDPIKMCAFKNCGSGQGIVLTGFRCEHDGCDAHIHLTCQTKRILSRQSTCPLCSLPWSIPESLTALVSTIDNPPNIPANAKAPGPVGEDAAPVREDRFADVAAVNARGRKRKAGQVGGDGEGDEESSSEDEEESVVQASQRAAKRPMRPSQASKNPPAVSTTRRRRAPDEEEDADEGDELESEG